MRTPAEIVAEIESLGAPRPSWRSMGAIRDSLEAMRRWRETNPAANRRHEELLYELQLVEAQAAEVAAAERATHAAKSAGIGSRTLETAESAQDTPAMLATRQWLNSGRSWLLLAGDVGTGKSVAAAWALLEVAKQGQRIAFRRASEIARMSGFDVGAKDIAALKSVGLLVVDDLGTECQTGWAASIFHELFDARHEAKRRTIITSNLKRADARARLGDRLSDRVQQDGRVVWLEGSSMRAKKERAA